MCAVRIWRYGDDVAMRVHLLDDALTPETEQVVVSADVEVVVTTVARFLARFRDEVTRDADPPAR